MTLHLDQVNQPQVENHLRALERYGFDCKPLWSTLAQRVADQERGVPSPEDVKYTVPTTAPVIGAHFTEGMGRPQVLAAHVLWPGYHYSLSPGQRRWFRDVAGMTPAQTVTIMWVQVWPGTQHPKAFRISSDVHVDPRHRAHVLTEFTVTEAGKFFTKAQEYDNETREADVFELNPKDCRLGYYYNLESVQRWAISDLFHVEIGKRVQVTMVNDTHFRLEDQVTGKQVLCEKVTFFSAVGEYAELYKNKKSGRRVGGSKTAPDFGSMMSDLEREFGM